MLIDYGNFDYHLIKPHRIKLSLTQAELAEWVGVSRMSISKYEKGEPIQKESLKKLIFFLNCKDKGELCNSLFDDYGMKYATSPIGEYKLLIPYLPVVFYNHYLSTLDFGELKLEYTTKEINSGFYAAFEVKGEAMDDGSRESLAVGDIVIAKELSKDDLTIDENACNVWVIMVDKDILFRKVERIIEGENKIVFKALNPSMEYADFSLKISDLKKIYQVVQRRTNF